MVDVRCFPSQDATFAAVVDRVLLSLSAADYDIDQFKERLQAIYPAAVVRAQHPLATLVGLRPVRYVIRDGISLPEERSARALRRRAREAAAANRYRPPTSNDALDLDL